MQINLDGKQYRVPDFMEEKLIDGAKAAIQEKYDKLDTTLRLGLKPVSRTILMLMEKKYGPSVRPEKGADPNLHIAYLFLALIQGGMKLVEATITTEGDSLTAFSLSLPNQNESGGPLAADGDIREREDNSSKVAR